MIDGYRCDGCGAPCDECNPEQEHPTIPWDDLRGSVDDKAWNQSRIDGAWRWLVIAGASWRYTRVQFGRALNEIEKLRATISKMEMDHEALAWLADMAADLVVLHLAGELTADDLAMMRTTARDISDDPAGTLLELRGEVVG